MKTQAEIFQALLDGKTLKANNGTKAKLESGNISIWDTAENIWVPLTAMSFYLAHGWEISKEPEVYEVNCIWKQKDDSSEVYPLADHYTGQYIFNVIRGKKTKLRIEVIE